MMKTIFEQIEQLCLCLKSLSTKARLNLFPEFTGRDYFGSLSKAGGFAANVHRGCQNANLEMEQLVMQLNSLF